MNLDSASSPSSSNQPPPPARAMRGAIAAQVSHSLLALKGLFSDSCGVENRKQKCDEQRPRCSLCQKMKLECNYREPQPTKKDKTLVQILDRLKILESKIDDRLPPGGPVQTGFGPPQPAPTSQPSFSANTNEPRSYSASSLPPSLQPSPGITGRNQHYRHASAAHKMLTWPAIQQLLLQALPAGIGDLRILEEEGPAFIVQIEDGAPKFSLDEALSDRPFVGMQSQATRAAGGARTTFPHLTRDLMYTLAAAYFDTFNFIYPFMDRQNFLSDTLAKVQSEGFNGDTDSVIALLVFALGELALEGYQGKPIEIYKDRPSGVRGGTASKPPGLALFNEARKRIGFVMTDCELETVQIYSLTALYYESCSRHVDFWRLTVAASQACQILVTCKPINWNDPRGDLIKRAYWHCAIMETGLNLELDLPPTGLSHIEDKIGIPSFNGPFSMNIASSDTPSASDDFDGPTASSIKHLAGQLSQWRRMLPANLQWPEDDPTSFPTPQQVGGSDRALDPTLSPQQQYRSPLFTTDLDKEPHKYPYAYDIHVALLRTRYYYAKYMVYRPFVYKALHFPGEMTQDDAEGVAECLRVSLLPIVT
ncbi:hypothetical protein D0Z07_2544 [Hyphodiscus hymeniophilus]|uniref:Zn(2)-C6 fungal-type domain-containing protein n=1 Tax=Hyphodiscus hymeniophilus TaxID=353542 RepID=A0A9P7AZC4_9HELO|nr:hypothetical protein D0Z07_2544 [Hyphodiscus hymeniophilus]